MKGLTKRQSEVLSYIQQFINKNQYSPSYREIMNHFAFNSLGSVYKHVTILKRKGVLNGDKSSGRSLAPANPGNQGQSNQKEVSLIGQLSAGKIELFSISQVIQVPANLIHDNENPYALKVCGDFLIDEMMMDGDVLLVEAKTEVSAGETIIGLINHQEVIVKKYFQEGVYVRLVGQNSHHQSIILKRDHVVIQGIVVGLLRVY